MARRVGRLRIVAAWRRLTCLVAWLFAGPAATSRPPPPGVSISSSSATTTPSPRTSNLRELQPLDRLLLIGGEEATTFHVHLAVIGATGFDFRLGTPAAPSGSGRR
jgi:hypothetical protein